MQENKGPNRVQLYKNLRNSRLKDLKQLTSNKYVLATDTQTYEIITKNVEEEVRKEIQNAEVLSEIAIAFPEETQEPELDDVDYNSDEEEIYAEELI